MYVLVKDNNIIAGPNLWNPRLFKSWIDEEFDINIILPQLAPTTNTDLGNGITCFDVEETRPTYNSKIEKLDGPFFTFNEKAIATYQVNFKDLDLIKQELGAIVTNNRWNKEVGGVLHTIQGQVVKLDTMRGNREIYLQAVQMGADGISWKFNLETGANIWLNVSLLELQQIVIAIKDYVQAVFDWERLKIEEINNTLTAEALDLINLVE